jgi:quercetin dioxygenase-like cupin family protein
MVEAKRVSQAELKLLQAKVTKDGGALRYLEGAKHGLRTSIFHSQIVPGSGPPEHTHPYAEIFVLFDGQGRYRVNEVELDAEAGDVVIVPADSWHSFTNTGSGLLRHAAVHEAPAKESTFRSEPDLPD